MQSHFGRCLTESLFQFLSIACSQAWLLALFIFANLCITRAPPTARLSSVYKLTLAMNKQKCSYYPPHLTFLCLHNSHLERSVWLLKRERRGWGALQCEDQSKYNLRDHQGTLSLRPAQCLRAIRAHELIVIGLCSGRISLRTLPLLIVMHVPVPILWGRSARSLHDSPCSGYSV